MIITADDIRRAGAEPTEDVARLVARGQYRDAIHWLLELELDKGGSNATDLRRGRELHERD